MNKKILVVDDDSDLRSMMKTILSSNGHTVMEAESGEECLRVYKDFAPDIILLDLMMEKQDSGITVCKKIRETEKDMKIYLLSAVGEETAGVMDIQDIGFNGTMSKPVSPNELLDLVK